MPDTRGGDSFIWTETATGVDTDNSCTDRYIHNDIPYVEAVRFDESENPTILIPDCRVCACGPPLYPSFPASSKSEVTESGDGRLPPDTAATNHPGGWLFLNLNHSVDRGTWRARPTGAAQTWITAYMTAEDRLCATFSAAAMGNGCSKVPIEGSRPIGPVGGVCNPRTNPGCRVNDNP